MSLESFKAAHCREDQEDDADSYEGGARETEEDWESSAKIDKLCVILEAIRANDPGDKVIVFSQALLPY